MGHSIIPLTRAKRKWSQNQENTKRAIFRIDELVDIKMYRGIFSAPRRNSMLLTEREIDKAIREFESTRGILKPYAQEKVPHQVEA